MRQVDEELEQIINEINRMGLFEENTNQYKVVIDYKIEVRDEKGRKVNEIPVLAETPKEAIIYLSGFSTGKSIKKEVYK